MKFSKISFGITGTLALTLAGFTLVTRPAASPDAVTRPTTQAAAPPPPTAAPPATRVAATLTPPPAAPAAAAPVPVDTPPDPAVLRAEAWPRTRWGSRSDHPAFDDGYARRLGWPVAGPPPLPGAILPAERIVAFYGHPNSKRMGVLGEFPPEEMLARLAEQVALWEAADSSRPVRPALHMVAVVAQADAGPTGDYRAITGDATVRRMHALARQAGGILFVDLQVGLSDLREILPRFAWILEEPDVHLGIDPEFSMKGGERPGTRIGTFDADDINYASAYLAELVRRHDLPPKVFVVHRFTQAMVTNAERIRLRPEVQVVMHMDGFGPPWLKRDSYRDYIVNEPVQFAGFKIFYKQDDPVLLPEDLLWLRPVPLYIQYQ